MASVDGLNFGQVGADSLLRSARDFYFAPIAATTNYLVTTVDPSTFTAGTTTLTLTTAGGLMFRRARRFTMTLNDDDVAGGLTVTVRITGQRWGQPVSEMLTVTCTDTNDTTGTSVNVYDQITEIKVMAVTADAGDDCVCGIDGTSFGLDFPIDNTADVQSIINVSTNTEAAATAVSSTTVQAGAATGGSVYGGSYIKGITLADTDRWEVRYLVSRRTEGMGVQGLWR